MRSIARGIGSYGVSRPAGRGELGNRGRRRVGRAVDRPLTQQIQDDRINAIVLLSDGRNHPKDPAGRTRLLEQVAAENQESSVRIFTIPYGADADAELLDQIAERSKARYYDEAIEPTNIAVRGTGVRLQG